MRVTLNGCVVGDADQWLYDWFEIPAFSPGKVRQAVAKNPAGEDLTLEINSGGGSVFAGFEIYTVIREASCRTVAEVQSLAASAASTIMAACDHVIMSPVAQVMMHLPMTATEGNQRDHRESLRMLDSITESILNGYEAKCGKKTSRDQLRTMMNRSSWLSAQEAVDVGLADEILGADDPAAVMNSVGVPAAADLLARYETAVRNGAKAAAGHPVDVPAANNVDPAGDAPASDSHDDWRQRAAIALEKNRYLI